MTSANRLTLLVTVNGFFILSDTTIFAIQVAHVYFSKCAMDKFARNNYSLHCANFYNCSNFLLWLLSENRIVTLEVQVIRRVLIFRVAVSSDKISQFELFFGTQDCINVI